MLTALYCVLGLALLYVLTTGIFLALIRFPKENDEIFIDHTSWHFKMAYPFKKYVGYEIKCMQQRGISKCRYFGKLFWMTWIGWPYIVLQESIKFILYNIFTMQFGYLSLPDLTEMTSNCSSRPGMLRTNLKELNFPRLSGHEVLPIYVSVSVLYLLSWCLNPKTTWHWTLFVFGVIVYLVIIAAVIRFLLDRLKQKTKKTETATLASEWVKIKKRRFCPIVPVK